MYRTKFLTFSRLTGLGSKDYHTTVLRSDLSPRLFLPYTKHSRRFPNCKKKSFLHCISLTVKSFYRDHTIPRLLVPLLPLPSGRSFDNIIRSILHCDGTGTRTFGYSSTCTNFINIHPQFLLQDLYTLYKS